MRLLVPLLFAAAHVASGQQLTGIVRDLGSGVPIPGVVVLALDSAAGTSARVISDARGIYRIQIAPSVRLLRFLRIGFSPEERPISMVETARTLEVSMRPLSQLLASVQIRENERCPRRADHDLAFSLWEQASTALLAAIVSREATPPQSIRIIYKRIRSTSDAILDQLVQIDSASATTRPFVAVLSSEDFVRGGFARDSTGMRKYLAPYADALLEDGFIAAHCFRVRSGGPAQPNQVGLVFETPNRARNRVDVDGTIWVDTAARTLVAVEFQYVGLTFVDPRVRPGGEIWFRQMTNGLLISDRWHIRGSGANEQPGRDEFGELPRAATRVMATEYGGELVAAEWPDGSAWAERLGRVVVRAVDSVGRPVTDLELRLRGTNYAATTNDRGVAEIASVLPGPYRAVLSDSLLGRIGLRPSAPFEFTAVRDSVVERLVIVRPAVDNFRDFCANVRANDPRDALLVVRVRAPDGRPVSDVGWEVARATGADWPIVYQGRQGREDGTLDRCLHFRKGDSLRVAVHRDGQAPVIESRVLANDANVMTVTIRD